MAITASVEQEALAIVSDTSAAVMLFGSFARRDASADSDIDVLALIGRPARTSRRGRVNLSFYDEATLRAMAEAGALFVLHLRTDGYILRDPDNRLQRILDSYQPPTSYEGVRLSLREIANLLDVDDREYELNSSAFNELAIYLLRTALYARFAEEGRPTFSMATIAKVLDDPSLTRALALKQASSADFDAFKLARRVLEETLHTRATNQFGSIEALITNRADSNPAILHLGLRLLGRESPALGYHMLPMIG